MTILIGSPFRKTYESYDGGFHLFLISTGYKAPLVSAIYIGTLPPIAGKKAPQYIFRGEWEVNPRDSKKRQFRIKSYEPWKEKKDLTSEQFKIVQDAWSHLGI